MRSNWKRELAYRTTFNFITLRIRSPKRIPLISIRLMFFLVHFCASYLFPPIHHTLRFITIFRIAFISAIMIEPFSLSGNKIMTWFVVISVIHSKTPFVLLLCPWTSAALLNVVMANSSKGSIRYPFPCDI